MADVPKASSSDNLFARLGLTRVINVSGTETSKGASPVCPEVLEAVNALTPHSVDMLQLQSAACRTIAKAFGTEAGLVANCTAAGIATAVAACMAGDDLARVERLPDAAGMKNEVILQRGHDINYGGLVRQNIALSGARVVEIGAATECGAYALRGAIGPQTAAAIFVVSHHTVQSGLIDLETFCRVCHEENVPVIVDAAAEPDPRVFLHAGADLVITSMHKQFASLTGAAIAGRLDLVRACLFQEKGIARTMKAGKEAIIGAIAAIERWSQLDRQRLAAQLDARLVLGRARLNGLPGISVTVEPDASRMFSRLQLHVDPAGAGMRAGELASALAAQEPSIFVRSLKADIGILEIDLRRVSDETAEWIMGRIKDVVTRAKATKPHPASGGVPSPANAADLALARLQQFPLPPGSEAT